MMREYGKVSPQFWMGETGKRIRAAGMEAQIVGLYLVTNPHANMLGLYYLPITFICHETGLPFEGASKALASLSGASFCEYDHASEVVWVLEMAKYQIADSLKLADKRCAGIQREYDQLPANPYLARFFERYQGAFHLTECRGETVKKSKGLRSPSKASSKPRAGAGAGAVEEKQLSGKPDDTLPHVEPTRSPSVEVLEYLNERAGREYRPVEATLGPILARLESGVTIDQCRRVIDAKVAEWGNDPAMAKYLRPETLFNRTKFEQYLGALGAPGTPKSTIGVPEWTRQGFGSAEEMHRAEEVA